MFKLFDRIDGERGVHMAHFLEALCRVSCSYRRVRMA